jgi:acyl CoA:acetate/3-ketoacid CoA transferase beta subunit
MTSLSAPATAAEFIMYELAKCIEPNDFVMLGNFTLLGHGAASLAKLTHAKDCYVVQEYGYDIPAYRKTLLTGGARGAGRMSLVMGHNYAHQRGLADIECVSPAQVDVTGSTNTSLIRRSGQLPIRLSGGAGQANIQTYLAKNIVYTTRHTPRVLVEKVDFQTGNRHWLSDEERRAHDLRPGPSKLVTSLCVFTMNPETRRYDLTSLHDGITLEQVKESTGWEITDARVPNAPPPPPHILELLRTSVDPLGVLALECLSSKERIAVLGTLLRDEVTGVSEMSRDGFGQFLENMGLSGVPVASGK